MKCCCLHDRVIENGHARNPLTLWAVPINIVSYIILIRVWAYILDGPQRVQLRNVYNYYYYCCCCCCYYYYYYYYSVLVLLLLLLAYNYYYYYYHYY